MKSSFQHISATMHPAVVVTLLLAVSVTDAGVSFIRWGRTVCPDGSQVLYKGFTAGPKIGSGGGGSNFLCMHEKPSFIAGSPGRGTFAGVIVGAEYDYTGFTNVLSTENMPNGVITSQDVPCVRCYVSGSTDAMMVPGRSDCGGSGYEFKYSGVLMSEYSSDASRKRSSYICMDHAPEGIMGGEAANSDALLYPVEVGCGSLPCNPYVSGKQVTCAICTY